MINNPELISFDPNLMLHVFRAAIARRDWVVAASCADLLDGYLTAGGDLPAQWHRASHPEVPGYRPQGLGERLAALSKGNVPDA
jgi:hypothetical protein